MNENERKEIDRIIEFLETDTYGLSDDIHKIINRCIEQLELAKE